MNLFQKTSFCGFLVLAAAYAAVSTYGQTVLLLAVVITGVLALLTLAIVRRALASLLQLPAYALQLLGFGVAGLGGWTVARLQGYKDGLRSPQATSDESHEFNEDAGIGILDGTY